MSEMKSLTLNDKTYDCFVDKTARSMATWSALIESASGESISMSDASGYNLPGLRVFGKTTQDGTPTPDAPVELMCVGESGSITVNVTGENNSQSMTIETPNGLPGVPVISDGNYTDTNGQQWVCDEKDFARGLYVQRMGKTVLSGKAQDGYYYVATHGDAVRFDVRGVKAHPGYSVALCTHLPKGVIGTNNAEICSIHGVSGYPIIQILSSRLESMDTSGLEKYLAGNPMTLYYVLETPIETPLPEEELAAYADLHTYKDNTTVYNDAGAYMNLEYVMDAKKYIDSMISASGIIPATVE